MYDFTNVEPVKCCTWLVLPTVYDESLSYGEQLNKFCKALNELIENNNNIPDYVAEMIQNYITSGAIDEVVRNVLASYILNVKYPPKGITPAVGDGSADDTEAIQGCIDYAFNQGGGCVYLPYGKYLSRSLTLRNGVSLIGFDRYSTRIVQRGGDTKPLVSGGNVQNVQISNLTLDGNNEVQTDDLDVLNILGKDVLLNNLVVKSGYHCLVYNGLGGDLQVSNVVFGGAVKKVAVINGKDSVQFENVKFNELGQIQGEAVLEVGASDGVYKFSSRAITPICINVSGSRNRFICDILNATNNFNDSGFLNNFDILGVEVKEQLANKVEIISDSKTVNISKNKSENIAGNREIDVAGADSIHVDGVSSVNIGGARIEVYNSSKDAKVIGTNNEEYYNTMTETFKNKHIVNGKDELNSFDGSVANIANKFTFNSSEKNFKINFPDKTVDIYNLKTGLFKSVLDYGAKGDGITDDSNAFKECINNNNYILIPKGTYIITTSLPLHDNTTIIGENGTKIISSAPEYTFIANGDSKDNKLNGISIYNLSISGNLSSTTTPTCGIFLIRCNNINLHFINIDTFNQGIRCSESTNINITNILTNNIKRTSDFINGYSILTQDTKNLYIANCVLNCERHGVYLYLFNNAHVNNCDFSGSELTSLSGYEVPLKFGGGNIGYVNNCTFHDAYGGVEISHNQINTVGSTNILINNCVFYNYKTYASKRIGWIYTVENESLNGDVSISNCYFADCNGRDININAGFNYTINNCTIKGNNSTFAAIRIVGQASSSNNSISNVKIYNYSLALDVSTSLLGTVNNIYLYNTPILAENTNLNNLVIANIFFNSILTISSDNPNIWGRTHCLLKNTSLTKLLGGNIGDVITLQVPAGSSVSGNIKVNGNTFTGISYGELTIQKRTDSDWVEISRYPAYTG